MEVYNTLSYIIVLSSLYWIKLQNSSNGWMSVVNKVCSCISLRTETLTETQSPNKGITNTRILQENTVFVDNPTTIINSDSCSLWVVVIVIPVTAWDSTSRIHQKAPQSTHKNSKFYGGIPPDPLKVCAQGPTKCPS